MAKDNAPSAVGGNHNTKAVTAVSTGPLDINAETYPFETVQDLLDQAAYFNMLSTPNLSTQDPGIHADTNRSAIIGIHVNEILHQFNIAVERPVAETGLRARNVVGKPAATFSHRWMIIPYDFAALPEREPPPTLLNPYRPQRFVMLDGVCTFGDGQDGFRGFGTGVTYPASTNGSHGVLVAAIGNIMEGFGKFRNLEGTYTYCGVLSVDSGFYGNLMCRVMDPAGALRTDREIIDPEPCGDTEAGVTYLLFHGEKKGRESKTRYRFGSGGQIIGLNVDQQLRIYQINFACGGRGGLRSRVNVGPIVGRMTSCIDFNLFSPGAPGTATAPIPFSAYNEFTFFDRHGRDLGGFAADGGEGRTFTLRLPHAPGQAALRFAGVGPLLKGTGWFAGIEGIMTDNSVVGITPHVTSTLYVLRVNDPNGRFRSVINRV
jgi:hypothetical protein